MTKILARLRNEMRRIDLPENIPMLSQTGPVRFVHSTDDSAKPRPYFYYGNQTALTETHFGSRIMLDLRDVSIAPVIIHTGWWEPWIEILLRSLLKPGMNYLNGGANFGYHTLLGAQLVGEHGRVYSYEPNPHLCQLLKRSIFINGFSPRTALYQEALFDRSGETEFGCAIDYQGAAGINDIGRYPSRDQETKGKINFRHWGDEQTITVPVTTIDETAGKEINQLNVLHLDIECAEGPALLGAKEIIQRSPDLHIIIEQSVNLPPDILAKYQGALDFLEEQGFNLYLIQAPAGNVYIEPPLLQPITRADLLALPHCDLFISRQ